MDTTKKTIDETQAKIQKINAFHNSLFESGEDSTCLKDQIEGLKQEIETLKEEQEKLISALKEYHDKTLIGTDEEVSTAIIIEELIDNYTNKLGQLDKKQGLFETFYVQAFEGTSEEISYQSQLKSAITQIKNDLSESEDELRELRNFHAKVIDSESKEGKKIPGLETAVNNLKNRLTTLISDANNKLHSLTDSSLHNAFATRAANYTQEFQSLQKYTFWSIAGLIFDIMAFGLAQIVLTAMDKPFSYHVLIYQFSIAGALVLAIWMFNRNQKIAKKLAEEYHHKASISEAMTGYRTLYGLDHDDEEYLALFNSIKDQLNVNPSKHIDTFLNLKSPHEEFTGAVTEILNPKNLELLANQLKPFLEKGK
jgi:predicted  nucleic acid-binding Zn-ribbon protein